MASYNKVLLMGNLTRDPEVRYTPKGTAVCDLGLAVNRVYTGDNNEKREETTFVDVTLWGKTAELAAQYLTKGRPVFIEGRLKYDTWDDKTSGQKRSKLSVVGESMQFIGAPKGASDGEGGGPPRSSGPRAGAGGGGGRPPQQSEPKSDWGESAAPEEDDIPF
jgi:single-strand DNA-binding protein